MTREATKRKLSTLPRKLLKKSQNYRPKLSKTQTNHRSLQILRGLLATNQIPKSNSRKVILKKRRSIKEKIKMKK